MPLTIYTGSGEGRFVKLIWDGEYERKLRNKGLGLVYRTSVFDVVNDDLEVIRKKYIQDGNKYIKTTWHCSKGEISKISQFESGYGSKYVRQNFIQKDEDYRIITHIIKNNKIIPRYEHLRVLQRNLGQDGIVMVRTNKTAYNQIIYELSNLEKFCVDLHEENAGLMTLLNTLREYDKKMMKTIANSPAELVQIPDNITSPMIGDERFKSFCSPFYNWAWDLLRSENKLLCVHMDGQLSNIADEIKKSQLPIIEGFTPPPDGDFSLREARDAWPNKALWINFPSSVHLQNSEKIKNRTEELIENSPDNGFLFGITENVPEKDWFRSLSAILDVLNSYY